MVGSYLKQRGHGPIFERVLRETPGATTSNPKNVACHRWPRTCSRGNERGAWLKPDIQHGFDSTEGTPPPQFQWCPFDVPI